MGGRLGSASERGVKGQVIEGSRSGYKGPRPTLGAIEAVPSEMSRLENALVVGCCCNLLHWLQIAVRGQGRSTVKGEP